MTRYLPPCLLPAALILAGVLSAAATVTRHADFPLGEPGTLGGYNQPQDVSGNGRHFTAQSGGISVTTAATGLIAPGSTACLDTSASTDQWWSGGPSLTGITDNFAFGVYARASSNTNGSQGDIFCTNASGNAAYKLSLDTTGWNASAHNIAYIGARNSNFTANTWVHLALIRSGGQTTFYVNGVAQGASYATAPSVGSMSIGGFSGSVFDGQLDEARVVTFTTGESTSNILAALQTAAAPATTAPVITSEPPDQAVNTGDTVMLAAPATGAAPMTWTWYHGSTVVGTSTTSAALVLTNVTTADAGTYHAEISNSIGAVTTRTLTLTVAPPLITLAPATTPNAGQQAMINRKYGMFCHFGINTFQNQQWTDGTVSPSTYTPTAVDVDQWVRTAYLSGMTYILIIAKHHDGFCMWPSAHTTYDVASSPNTTDVMQLAAAACQKYGIKLAVYYSLWDRNWSNGAMRTDANSLSPAQGTAYVTYMKNQLTELLGNYGPVCELWLDGGWVGPDSIWNLPDVYNHVKQLQPDCQMSSNLTIGNPAILPANQTAGNAMRYFPCDFRLYDPYLPKFPDPKTFTYNGNTYYLPFEATITLSSQNFWFYDTRENASKSLGQLENWWNVATAQNNLLVFNAAPDRAGKLLSWDIATLSTLSTRLGLEPGGLFPANLATAATATASSVLNNDNAASGPSLATDENPDSRWSAAAGSTSGWIELDFGAPTTFARVIVNEYLSRTTSHNLQWWDGSAWQTITTGTTLGESKRIDFPAVTTTRLRLNILTATDSPSIWNFKVQTGGTSPPAPDNNSVWTSSTGGVWQVAGHWQNSTIASGTDRTADFSTLDLASDATVILQNPLSIGSLAFADTTPTHDWTLEPVSNQALTLAAATGSPTITVSNRTATITTILDGTAGLTKTGAGTLVLAVSNTYTGPTAIDSGVLLVNGSTAAASPVAAASNATLGGTGTIHGSVTLAPGATLAPGSNGIGTLTIDTALTLPAGASTVMEISKSGSTLTNDRLAGLPGLACGGTLAVTATGDPLSSGDSFTLFSLASGSISGTFATLNLPALPAGLKWDTTALTTTGTLTIVDTGAARPVFSPPAGYHYGAQSVTLTCATPGSVIRYTTDGSTPTSASPVYSTPIPVPSNSTLVINAIASVSGLDDSPQASATYTTGTSSLAIQAWYRLGETSSLGTSNRPQDSSGNNRHFSNNQNTTTASTEDAGGPLGRSGITSTDSLLCGSGQINGFWNNGYSLPADNAGMEIWVKPSTGYTDGWIIATGSASTHLVLAISGGKFRASATGGTSWFDDAATAVSTTAWTHLALVRAGGTTTFYVNGVAHGTTAATVTTGTTTHLAVTSGGNSGFKGLIDEARMFTFAAGAFDVKDLLHRINRAPAFDPNPRTLTITRGTAATPSAAATDADAGDTLTHAKLTGPAWLTVAPDGTLGGTPGATDLGSNIFTLRATDAFGAAATLVLTVTVLDSDTNTNGILDTWEQEKFGNTSSGANLPLDDADGDGLCNLLEFALGTHPGQSNKSTSAFDLVPVSGHDHLRVTVPKNPAATNLVWTVEMSDTLAAGSWTAVPTVIEEETSTLLRVRSADPVATTPRRFARVRVAAAQ